MPCIEVRESIARIPVSLRLPAPLYQHVEQFAVAHNMRKTDAFIHFIELGIKAAVEPDTGSPSDRDTQRKLDAIIELLHEALDEKEGRDRTVSNWETRQLEREEIIDAIREAASRFPAIERAYLFGSVARGTFTDRSDIDVRIEMDQSMTFNLHDLVHFSKFIEQATGREVDVVSARKLRNENLARAIEADKELVYERQA